MNNAIIRVSIVALGYAVVAVSILIWLKGDNPPGIASPASQSAAVAEWRKHNCAACHAIFGLGGHIGPDLTNVMKRRQKEYIRAVVLSGLGGMPAFELNKVELDQILSYLAKINDQGVYPLRSHDAPVFGISGTMQDLPEKGVDPL